MFQEITQESHPFEYNIDSKYNYSYSSNDITQTYNINIDSNQYEFYKQAKCINLYGSISPHGPIIDTPDMIKLPLKLHQKRTVYHMEYLENLKNRIICENILILSDNVGSGKSYCILSLIARKPKTEIYNNTYYIQPRVNIMNKNLHHINGVILKQSCIEFNSNLIVVPHGIYTQWFQYLSVNTTIPYLAFSSLIDFNKLGNTKESIITTINSVYIILIKSTIYNDFIKYLASYNIVQDIYHNAPVENVFSDEENPTNRYSLKTDERGNKIITFKTPIIDKKIIIDNIYKATDILKSEIDTNMNVDEMFNKYLEKINTNYNAYKRSINSMDVNMRHSDKLTIIGGYIFQRIIFDEADSIKIPNCLHYMGKITWLVTSSFLSLLYERATNIFDTDTNQLVNVSNGINGLAIIRDTMKRICYNSFVPIDRKFRIFSTIVRNHPEFVKMSIDIPRPLLNRIRCFTPLSFNAVQNALGADIIRALNAGDINEASNLLGYEIHTENDIIESVTKSLNDKKNDLLKNINIKKHEVALLEQDKNSSKNEYERLKELYKNVPTDDRPEEFNEVKKNYYTINSRLTHIEKTIHNYTNDMNDIESKIKNIIDRLENPTAKTCPICMDNIKNPCIAICCKNVFCLECIEGVIQYKKNCPLCRTIINKSSLHIIKEDEKDTIENNIVLLEKLDVLSNYLLMNNNKRILIFSEYEKTFELIEKRLTQLGIKHSRIIGNTHQINKVISEYTTNKVQVLMLNATFFGAGINLQMTDDIFVYHRMRGDLEKQVIGRAQRLGRKEPLNIHYLCYDNEYNINEYNENIGDNSNHINTQ